MSSESLMQEVANLDQAKLISVIHRLIKEQEKCPHCSKKWEKGKLMQTKQQELEAAGWIALEQMDMYQELFPDDEELRCARDALSGALNRTDS
jgi:hypothetical protein